MFEVRFAPGRALEKLFGDAIKQKGTARQRRLADGYGELRTTSHIGRIDLSNAVVYEGRTAFKVCLDEATWVIYKHEGVGPRVLVVYVGI